MFLYAQYVIMKVNRNTSVIRITIANIKSRSFNLKNEITIYFSIK